MKKIIIIVTLLAAMSAHAQDQNQNYVESMEILDPTDNYWGDDNNAIRYTCTIQYYNGMGQPTISATRGISTDGNYVYTAQMYNQIVNLISGTQQQ